MAIAGLRMDELSAEVEVLESKLSKTQELSKKISLSLEKLSTSATNVETAVKPIYSKTQSLLVMSTNIDEAINAIDRIRQPTDVVPREEATIRRGPQDVGLSEYLASLKRVDAALASLKKANLRSTQKSIQQMTGLVKAGTLQLEDLFRKALAEDSKPVEPLHYITKDLPFPVFSSQKVNTLAVLNDFLSSTLAAAAGLSSNTHNVYAEVRGPYITSSLSSLALATVNTTRRTGSAPYEKGSNGIGMYARSLESILISEYDNICHVFNSSTWGQVYAGTIGEAMSVFKKTLRDLNNFVKLNMGTDLFLSYDVIECVLPVSSRIKNKTGEGKVFADALQPIRQTAQSTFSFLLEDLKRAGQILVVLPVDNTVADITVETMSRLRRVADYQMATTSLLVSLGDGNWKRPSATTSSTTTSSFDVGADGVALLSHFCLDVIDQLIHELEQKARSLIKKASAISIFMVNNVAYIESQVRRTELSRILSISAQQKVEKWRKDAVKMYLDGWKECAAFLMDVTYTGKRASSHLGGHHLSLTSKEKDGVKEKFKNFNQAFEECVQKHKAFSIPDREVRQMLAKEIGFVGPLYGRFYDKYRESVNQKYIKWDRQGLEQVLGTL